MATIDGNKVVALPQRFSDENCNQSVNIKVLGHLHFTPTGAAQAQKRKEFWSSAVIKSAKLLPTMYLSTQSPAL